LNFHKREKRGKKGREIFVVVEKAILDAVQKRKKGKWSDRFFSGLLDRLREGGGEKRKREGRELSEIPNPIGIIETNPNVSAEGRKKGGRGVGR